MVNFDKINAIKKGKPISVWDIVILIIIIIVSIVIIVSVLNKKGDSVEIHFEGKTASYKLTTDREIDLGGKIKVVIKNREVWVAQSDCKNQICVKSGKIKFVHQTLACTPNGALIRIKGNSDLQGVLGN